MNGIITALLHPVHPANKLFLISGFPPAMIENKMIDQKKYVSFIFLLDLHKYLTRRQYKDATTTTPRRRAPTTTRRARPSVAVSDLEKVTLVGRT